MEDRIEIYESDDGKGQEVMYEQDTVWLSQHQIAELFKQSKQNISLHVENVFKEHELEKVATVKDYLTVQSAEIAKVKRKISYTVWL